MDSSPLPSPALPSPATNIPELTVGELSGALKRTIEDRFGFVRVRGEISNYRGAHSSGHAYFCLKDETARIDAVVWKTAFLRLKTKPQEGLEVIATGRVTTYPGKSTYQIVIESLEPAGIGALMAILEARRKALAAEGLFDEGRKRRVPFLPHTVGVVTSPTGAVIRDILHRIADRFPRNVLVWPVRVQGDTAAAEVAAAVAGFDALPREGAIARPDVLIVARGGGSLEDLWAFNEEIVVRAVSACSIPVISAVGHETDWTLIDHVADLRAPTPSGAAEKAVPVRADLVVQQSDLARRHHAGMLRVVDRRRNDVRALARALPGADTIIALPRQRLDHADTRLSSAIASARSRRRFDLAALAHRLARQAPWSRLALQRQRLDSLEQRLASWRGLERERRGLQIGRCVQRLASAAASIRRDLSRGSEASDRMASTLRRALDTNWRVHRRHLHQFGQLLDSLGYRQVLARGFALVRDGAGRPLRSVDDVSAIATVDIEFADGHIEAVVGGKPTRRRARPGVKPGTGQGSLF